MEKIEDGALWLPLPKPLEKGGPNLHYFLLGDDTNEHHGAKAKGSQRHCFYMCGVAQHTEDTAGRCRQGTHPSNDVAALQNEQVVCQMRNTGIEGGQTSVRPTKRLLQSTWGIGWA